MYTANVRLRGLIFHISIDWCEDATPVRESKGPLGAKSCQ